jgi:hypothetical protein
VDGFFFFAAIVHIAYRIKYLVKRRRRQKRICNPVAGKNYDNEANEKQPRQHVDVKPVSEYAFIVEH